MRICHFIASRGLGRGEFYVDLANAQADLAQVSMLVPRGALYLERISPAIQVLQYGAWNSRRNPLLKWELYRHFRALKTELVHTHFAKASEIFYSLNRVLQCPWVATKHNPRRAPIYNRINNVIAVSKRVGESIAGNKSRIIHNAITPNIIRPIPQNSKNVFSIMAVGRLDPIKGFDKLIREVAQLKCNFELTIVGEGSQRQALEKLIGQLGLDQQVSLPGFDKNIPERMAAADVVVVSSLSEGGPVAAIEALFYGKLLIATEVGITREILPVELIIKHDHNFDIARLLTSIEHDRTTYQQRFKHIQTAMQPNYLLSNIAAEHLAYYEEIMQLNALLHH